MTFDSENDLTSSSGSSEETEVNTSDIGHPIDGNQITPALDYRLLTSNMTMGDMRISTEYLGVVFAEF